MRRRSTQLAAAILTNSYWPGFLRSRIYKGPLKAVCVPFLNCYSCPGAWGACPVGSFQSLAAGFSRTVSFYIAGLLITVGAFGGRLICGWLCPFGFLQELLYKIKIKKRLIPTATEHLKYVVLVLTIGLPFFWRGAVGIAEPYYCKYICPAGTLEAGLPLLLGNADLRSLVGAIFVFKVVLLAAVFLIAIIVWRPFCRTLCPLGAFYSLFNPISLWRLQIDQSKCTECDICVRRCPLGLIPYKEPNSITCMRCLECVKACPTHALVFGNGITVPCSNNNFKPRSVD